MQNINQTYSTGQVSGLLGIPPVTLQRYIREFKEYFSETARQPDRGRRYTSADLNHLVRIRQMHTKHSGHDQIAQALADNQIAPEDLTVDNIFTVLEIANTALASTDKNAAKVEALTRQAAWKGPEYINLLAEMRKAIRELRYEQEILRFEMVRLKYLFCHPKTLPKKQPFALRSVWQKFQMWVGVEYQKDLANLEQDRARLEASRALYLKDHPQYVDDLE